MDGRLFVSVRVCVFVLAQKCVGLLEQICICGGRGFAIWSVRLPSTRRNTDSDNRICTNCPRIRIIRAECESAREEFMALMLVVRRAMQFGCSTYIKLQLSNLYSQNM